MPDEKRELPKRDESKDVWVIWDRGITEIVFHFDPEEAGIHSAERYVPAPELEAALNILTAEREGTASGVAECGRIWNEKDTKLETALKRVTELEEAARKILDNIPGCLCQSIEFDMAADDLNQLLSNDYPNDPNHRT
jgi:hypothetical protein